MKITRQVTARWLQAYLKGRLALADLVDWAERAMLEGDFAPVDVAVLRKVVPRLGVRTCAPSASNGRIALHCSANLASAARIDVVAA